MTLEDEMKAHISRLEAFILAFPAKTGFCAHCGWPEGHCELGHAFEDEGTFFSQRLLGSTYSKSARELIASKQLDALEYVLGRPSVVDAIESMIRELRKDIKGTELE